VIVNRCSFRVAALVASLAASVPSFAVTPDDENPPGNPFQSIVERNVFAIKPPPPVEEKPVEALPPPPPPTKVVLTGILNILGPPRALLEVAENEPGKQPNTKKPILREGEREGAIEVLAIDIVKNIVRIRNGNIETNLTFEALKQTTAPAMAAAPTSPALNMPPAIGANTGAILPTPSTTPAAVTTTSTHNGRRSITLAGAEPQPTAALGGASLGNNANMLAMGNQSYARQPRTVPTSAQPPDQAPADPAAQWVQLKAHELDAQKRNVRFPPTPPVIGLDDGTGGGPPPIPGGNRPPGFPPLPAPPMPIPR